jgi:adenylylsulfate kinase-like enzyme
MTHVQSSTDEAAPHGVATPPVILVLAGVSGAGKTTLASRLAALGLPGVGCYFFDTIGGETPLDELCKRFSDGEAFRTWALDQWFTQLLRNDSHVDVAVLDAQVRPLAARAALERHGVTDGEILFVHCRGEERHARLRGSRGQPELANVDMDTWAEYLRRESEELGIRILDTTGVTPEESLGALREVVVEIVASRGHSVGLSRNAS